MGQLFINNTEIDIAEDIVFPVTYAISDIKNPNTRKRSTTKTIKIPDSPKNRRFFSSSYQINLSENNNASVGFNFNHNIKYPARYISKGVTIFDGSCRFFSSTLTNGVLEVEVSLFSNFSNIYDDWNNLKISELGWSEYDHVLSKNVIEDSWSNFNTDGYVYGLVYFGYNNSPTVYKTNDLVPYVFVYEILKKALAFAGLELISNSLNSLDFKKMVWGFGGGEKISLTDLEVQNRFSFVNSDLANTNALFSPSSFTQGNPNDSSVPDNLQFNNTIQADLNLSKINLFTINNDNLNQANIVNLDWDGSFTISQKGMYRISVNGDILLMASWSYGSPDSLGFGASMNFYWEFSIIKNGFVVGTAVIDRTGQVDNVSSTDNLNLSSDVLCDSGDLIEFRYYLKSVNSYIYPVNRPIIDMITSIISMSFTTTGFDFKIESINKGLFDGDIVNIARYMPDVKVSDFFNDLITTNNLYISEPQDGSIRIESFRNYYLPSNNYDDWTDKIDLSKPIVFEPPKIEGANYKFKFAQDRDYYKKIYFEEFDEDYGDYSYSIANTYQKGDKIWQTKFAQTVPVNVAPSGLTSQLVIPVIANSKTNGATFIPYQGKARIFFYNGLKPCFNWSFRDSLNQNITSENTYPQFHHLNNVSNPTFDFNFGTPQKVYYTATNYTLTNIIQRDYTDFLSSVLSKSSKMVTAYFNLNESDFYPDFMRKLVNWDCVRFIKNLVEDYDPNNLETTMVELFKVVNPRSQSTTPDYEIPTSDRPSQLYTQGFGSVLNTDEPQVISAGLEVIIINNATTNNDDFLPDGIADPYVSEENYFDFSEIPIGSFFEIYANINVDSSVEASLEFFIKYESNKEANYIPMISSNSKSLGEKKIVVNGSVIIDEITQSNPIEIVVISSQSISLSCENYQYKINKIDSWKK